MSVQAFPFLGSRGPSVIHGCYSDMHGILYSAKETSLSVNYLLATLVHVEYMKIHVGKKYKSHLMRHKLQVRVIFHNIYGLSCSPCNHFYIPHTIFGIISSYPPTQSRLLLFDHSTHKLLCSLLRRPRREREMPRR